MAGLESQDDQNSGNYFDSLRRDDDDLADRLHRHQWGDGLLPFPSSGHRNLVRSSHPNQWRGRVLRRRSENQCTGESNVNFEFAEGNETE